MDKFRQISTELLPLIDDINWFFTLFLGISLPIFFKLCMKRSSFKMIFFALKYPVAGMLHACSAFILLKFCQATHTIPRILVYVLRYVCRFFSESQIYFPLFCIFNIDISPAVIL